MKLGQHKLFYFYNKSAELKTILLFILLLFSWGNLSAQKNSNIKLKIETGVLWDWVEGSIYLSGPFVNVEPRLKVLKNTIIGLRLGAAFNTQRILNADPNRFQINNYYENGGTNRVLSFVPTFDYYFTKNKFRPYLGLGLGYHFLATSKTALVIGNVDILDLSVNNTFGVLLRGGFDLYKVVIRGYDLSRFTIGLEFNYIPKTDVEVSNGQAVGTVVTSNIALSFGYSIGGGKG